MVIVSGTFRVPQGRFEEWMRAARAMLAASRAEQGCITYSYAVDVEDRTLIRVYEAWASRADLDTHFKEPHMRVWRAALADIGAHDRNIKFFEGGAPTAV